MLYSDHQTSNVWVMASFILITRQAMSEWWHALFWSQDEQCLSDVMLYSDHKTSNVWVMAWFMLITRQAMSEWWHVLFWSQDNDVWVMACFILITRQAMSQWWHALFWSQDKQCLSDGMLYSDQESHYYTGNKENISSQINISLSLSTLRGGEEGCHLRVVPPWATS